jgi:hypothetical protein
VSRRCISTLALLSCVMRFAHLTTNSMGNPRRSRNYGDYHTTQKTRRPASNPVGADFLSLARSACSLLVAHHSDKRQIAVQLVQVQSIAIYKFVRDVEADVVEFHFRFAPLIIIEQRADFQAGRPTRSITSSPKVSRPLLGRFLIFGVCFIIDLCLRQF